MAAIHTLFEEPLFCADSGRHLKSGASGQRLVAFGNGSGRGVVYLESFFFGKLPESREGADESSFLY